MNQSTHNPKRITSLLLAAALLTTPLCVSVSAASGTALQATLPAGKHKSEVVYASLATNGAVKNIYVVNRFEPNGEPMKDFGAYKAVKEISVEGDLQAEQGDATAVKTGKSAFFYQGELSGRTLPWTIALRYTLDGRPISAEQLAGKSGKFGLEMTITPVKQPENGSKAQNEENASWADQLMLQASVSLPHEVAEHISAEGGTLVQVGGDRQANFVVLPGSEAKTFSLQADVTNFHLPAVTIAGIPFSMNLDSFSLPDFSQDPDLQKLQEGTKALNDATLQLSSGLSSANKGYDELALGFGRLSGALEALKESSGDLAQGSTQFFGGLRTLQEKGKALREGLNTSIEGTDALQNAMMKVNEGWKGYVEGVKQYVSGTKQSVGAVTPLSNGANQLLEGATQMRDTLTILSDEGEKLLGYSGRIQAALTQLNSALSQESTDPTTPEPQLPTVDELQQAKTRVAGSSAQLQQAKHAVDTVYSAFGDQITALENAPQPDATQIVQAAGLSAEAMDNPDVQKLLAYQGKTAKEQTEAQLQVLHALYDTPGTDGPAPLLQLKTAMTETAQQADEMESAMTLAIENLQKLVEAINAFRQSSAPLTEGVKNLNTQYTDFHKGLTQYTKGIQELSKGFGKTKNVSGGETPVPQKETFYDGLEGLANGLKQWKEGSSALLTGGDALIAPETTQALLNGQEQVAGGVTQFTSGLGRLFGGMKAYSDGVDQLAENSSTLETGLSQYLHGVGQTSDGMTQWQEGFSRFGSGLASAANGAQQLADGTAQFAAQSGNMNDKIEEKVQSLMNDMKPKKEEITSFADARNGKIAQVQFVLMTEEIRVPEEQKKETPRTEKTGFLDRLRNLFSPKTN